MKKKNIVFRGKLTSGKFKGQDFEIISTDGWYYNTSIFVGGKQLSGIQKISIVFTVEEPAKITVEGYDIDNFWHKKKK